MPRSSPRRASSSKAIIFAMGLWSSDLMNEVCVSDPAPATDDRQPCAGLTGPTLALVGTECQCRV
jgi:hypothetical protein